MKAAQVSRYGNADVISVVEVDKPSAGSNQVLIEVKSVSLNPFDTVIREGYMKEMIPLELPFTIGGDIAGTVVELGENVTNIAVGDKVYGQANVVAGNSGAFAEFAATAASQITVAPSDLDFNQAASLPLVGVSALQGLTEHITLSQGKKIFIHGGAGGIGSVAIQIAKNLGAYVATTASGDGVQLVKELGADEIIDYKTDTFIEKLKEYDAVFDTVGGDDFAASYSILKEGGIAVTMIGKVDEASAKEHGILAFAQQTHVTTDALNALRDLVESGVVTTRIGKVFSLEEVCDAFKARESSQVQGKIVLTV